MALAQQITWRERLEAYYYLCRFDKPIGTELVFWPTMWALWIANQGMPSIGILIPMILGTIFMRAAGCAINDFADRNVDGHVERTKTRPLATGVISAKEAIYVFLDLVALSAAMLLFLPIETFYWSFGALFLAFIYPFMKRYTHLPQVFLGAAFSWSIPMAYTAVGATPDLTCWLLYFGNLAWTVAYDTQYAITDREYDLKIWSEIYRNFIWSLRHSNYFIVASGQCAFDWYGIVVRKFTDSIWFGSVVGGGGRLYISMA